MGFTLDPLFHFYGFLRRHKMLKWLRKSQCGQAMVEMALVLPILVLLIGGIMDFGWLFYNKTV